jgi:hypothetical protein
MAKSEIWDVASNKPRILPSVEDPGAIAVYQRSYPGEPIPPHCGIQAADPEPTSLERIARALTRIADRLDQDAGVFEEMVAKGNNISA